MEKRIIHLSVHPRFECKGNCKGCYLKRQKNNKGPLTWITLNNALSQVDKFAKRHDFNHISYAMMVNTTTISKTSNDVAMLALLLAGSKIRMKTDYADVYMGTSILEKAISKPDWRSKLYEWCTLVKHIGSDTKVSTSLWLSDIWSFFEEYKKSPATISEAEQILTDISQICRINTTVTVSPSTNVNKVTQHVRRINKILRKKPILYIDMWDNHGKVDSKSVSKAMSLIREGLLGLDIEPDFCIIKNIDNDFHKIVTIFPDGTTKNCPYLAYEEKGNLILNADYCYTKCPHKLDKSYR